MIRFGVIGPGIIAHTFAKDMKHVKNTTITAVASRNLERALSFANDYNIPNVYDSYEKLFESGEVDAIYIATPHNFHKNQAIKAMSHKLHVLCEKPISVNANEYQEMIQSSIENKVVLMEAMWSRFLPALNHVKEYIKQHQNWVKMELNFGYILDKNYPKSGRLLNPELAGGVTLDLGVYPVSIMNHLTKDTIGSIESIGVLSDLNIDLDIDVKVHFENNKKAQLRATMIKDIPSSSYIIYEDYTVEITHTHHSQKIIYNGEEVLLPFVGEGFTHQIESFVDTINSNHLENDIMSHFETMKTMKLLDEIRSQLHVKYPFE